MTAPPFSSSYSSSSTAIVVPAPNPRAIFVADAVSMVSAAAFVRQGTLRAFGRTPSTHTHAHMLHDYMTYVAVTYSAAVPYTQRVF